MIKRTITAICAIALFIPICVFSDTVVFPLAMSLLAAVGVYEMLGCVGIRERVPVSILSLIFGFTLPMTPYILKSASENTLSTVFAQLILYMILMFAIDVLYRGKIDYTVTSSAFMGVAYIAVSFASIVMLRAEGKYLYLLVFIGPWVSDTFAYIFCRLLGKHKLIPEISPKKTVEGSIAGIIFAGISFVIYGAVIAKFIDSTIEPNYISLAIVGMVVSVISQIGDLSASAVKRRLGIKDYGFIFPGHGGVMDRFDSVIMTAPVLYILTNFSFFTGILGS